MKELKLPKQEEVQDFDLGNGDTIRLVQLTDENRSAVLEAVLQTYLDDECMYCHKNFTTEEVKNSVWAHPNQFGRIVHRQCWNANNSDNK